MLLALAYRLLGQVTEAEDVVQDAWLRWSAADRGGIANPAAYLTTVTTRLALDRLRSAAARREVYVGPWLPEPLPTADPASDPADPADSLVLRETASMGMLLLLDRLSPAERAVFVLREAFGLPYPEIAEILDRTEDSCRQLLSRARRHVAAGRGATIVTTAEARPLVDAFLAAARGGDLGRLRALLREDVVVTSDGNGAARAGRHPIHGAEKAARLFAKVFERFYTGRAEIAFAWYNSAPALVIQAPVHLVVYVFGCDAEGRIAEVYCVLNPDKLRHVGVGGPAAPGAARGSRSRSS
ncbi:RNA polymerase subunit sigma-24 [Streptacidiphilus pinicola]|uniref:RNA polymerase subunit sigma-24 n=2 Tax=Streptacidiphilus pinicola TaxID=2219663 RepID=A0A2X0IGG2_9ACTN|nr:RNA polymerase subunit sigma-24 [Streptacidiphilus pinicola]